MFKHGLLLLLAVCMSNPAYGITIYNYTHKFITISSQGKPVALVDTGELYDFKSGDTVQVFVDGNLYTVGVEGSSSFLATVSTDNEGGVQIVYKLSSAELLSSGDSSSLIGSYERELSPMDI